MNQKIVSGANTTGQEHVCCRLKNIHRWETVQAEKGGEVMRQMTLCARCSSLMRDRHIVKLVERRDINSKIDCDNCKRHAYGATYEVEPMRREKP